jgi:hypothetical protein
MFANAQFSLQNTSDYMHLFVVDKNIYFWVLPNSDMPEPLFRSRIFDQSPCVDREGNQVVGG